MPYPPEMPARDLTDQTPTKDVHAPHHDALAAAIADIVDELGAAPSGSDADLTLRLAALGTSVAAATSSAAAASAAVVVEEGARVAGDAAAVPKAGGTMTGPLVLSGDPTANLHATTRQYVQAQVTAAVAQLLGGAPAAALDTIAELAAALTSDESAAAALTTAVAGKLAKAANLSDLTDAVAARGNLGLGSAATHPATDFDAAGAAAAEGVTRAAADALLIPLTQRGAVNGVATLDGAGTVPDAQIPATIARDSETAAAVSAAVAALVNSSPSTLDTLAELATALGNDPNFATTITAALAAKVAKAGDTMTGELVLPSAKVSGKGGLSPRTFAGRKTTAGAPTSGTWATDDEIMDSLGVIYRCTAGGTPGTWAAQSGTSVLRSTTAPELVVTKVKNTSPETSGAVVKVLARDPATGTTAPVIGAALTATPTAVLYGFSGNVLYKSTDDGTTWAVLWTFTGYAGVEQAKVLASGVIVVLVRQGTIDASVYDLFRSTDGVNFAAIATQPFTRVSPFSRLLNRHSIGQVPADGSAYAGNLFMGEYGSIGGAANPPVRVFRSTDDGATWTTATTFDPNGTAGTSTAYGPMALDEIRHVHEVRPDPYVAGRIWITIGDNLTGVNLGQPRIGFSDDGGATWTQITRASKATPAATNVSYQQSRAVGLMFSADAVFWFGDTPEASGYVWRYDRVTHAITSVAGPWPNSGQNIAHSWTLKDGTPLMLTSLSVEPSFQINRDDVARLVGSTDGGATWVEMMTWKRTQVDQTSGTIWPYFTDPDANDEFWLTLDNVDGGAVGSTNFISMKVQASHRPITDRTRPAGDHRARFEHAAREATVTCIHPDTNGTGAVATINDYVFFRCPTDLIVVEFFITSRAGLGGSASNYWTASLVAYNGTTGASRGTVGQAGGASANPGARVAWPQVSANGLLKAMAGDWLALGCTMTGAPSALIDLAVSVRYRRANVIV